MYLFYLREKAVTRGCHKKKISDLTNLDVSLFLKVTASIRTTHQDIFGGDESVKCSSLRLI